MKIKKVEIENFRGIDSLTLDMADPWGNILDLVVLAGPNGMGKTSVLEACLLALGYSELLGKGAQPENNIRIGTSDYSINVTIDKNGKEIGCPHNSELIRDPQRSREDQCKRMDLNFPIEYFSSWRAPKVFGPIHNMLSIPKKTEENLLSIVKTSLFNLRVSTNVDDETEKIMKYENEKKEVYSKLEKAWKLFYPEKNSRFIVKRLGDKVEDGFDVFLNGSEMKQSISVDNLSSGEIEIFTMLAWFAIKDYSGGIIFIDEPELHLHPAWHRIVLRAIRTVLPDTQIICATHSSEILDYVYSYERFTLLPEGDPRVRVLDNEKLDASQS